MILTVPFATQKYSLVSLALLICSVRSLFLFMLPVWITYKPNGAWSWIFCTICLPYHWMWCFSAGLIFRFERILWPSHFAYQERMKTWTRTCYHHRFFDLIIWTWHFGRCWYFAIKHENNHKCQQLQRLIFEQERDK